MASPWASQTDIQLLQATAAGDEEAFLEIYRRHQQRVYRFAFRMTGSSEAARDVTHDCFASLLESPGRYEADRAGLGTYLCAAARHRSRRYAGGSWREQPSEVSPDRRPSRGPSPLELVLHDERVRLVRQAVLALAPLHREVLILADYEELDMATIARIVGAKVGTVKVRLHRARQKLRRVLEGTTGSGVLSMQTRTS